MCGADILIDAAAFSRRAPLENAHPWAQSANQQAGGSGAQNATLPLLHLPRDCFDNQFPASDGNPAHAAGSLLQMAMYEHSRVRQVDQAGQDSLPCLDTRCQPGCNRVAARPSSVELRFRLPLWPMRGRRRATCVRRRAWHQVVCRHRERAPRRKGGGQCPRGGRPQPRQAWKAIRSSRGAG